MISPFNNKIRDEVRMGKKRKWLNLFAIICLMLSIASCSTSKRTHISNRKYPPAELRADFNIFRGALEESHPGLYWFTPKHQMDSIFSEASRSITDSMTEREYRTLLTKAIAAIKCGHTFVNYSRKYSRFLDTATLKLFPLAFKVWKDTIAVTANLNKHDTVLKRGTIVTGINGRSSRQLVDTFLYHVTGDGFSQSGRYQSMSSYGAFGVLYKNVLGLPDSFNVSYLDDYGFEKQITVPVFSPIRDTSEKADSLKPEKYTPKERRTLRNFAIRHVQVDTTLKSAYMMLNTFARGSKLRRFFRNSFKNIQRLGIEHLVIDVRSNGGGEAANSTLLTQYLTDHSFKIGDSLYAIRRSSAYRDYIKFQPIYWLITAIITNKQQDGNYHFGYFERHKYKPFKKYHFDKNVYVITGGSSFSATTLFAQELKGQKNVKIIGEETGGGAYGNTAWIIPTLTLPHTKLRVGIPKFRFVMRRELVEEGRGVMPDIHISPTAQDIRRGVDVKLEAVRQMILQANYQ